MGEKLLELKGKAEAILSEYEGKALPEDKKGELDQTLAEMRDLKERASVRAEIQSYTPPQPQGTKAARATYDHNPEEEDVTVDYKAWREMELKMPTGLEVKRYYVPEEVTGKGYTSAYEAYMRKGKDGVGPNDLKTLQEGLDPSGGYLVPEPMLARIIQKMETVPTVYQHVNTMNVSSRSVTIPTVVYTTDNEYTTGVRYTYTGEIPATSTTHLVTDPVFGQKTINVHTVMASAPVTQDLVEDAAVDIFSFYADKFAEAFALGADNDIINGTGVGRPEGILVNVDTNDGPTSVAAGATDALSANNFVGSSSLDAALPSQYERNARYAMTKATEMAIRGLRAGGSTSGDGIYLWPITEQVGQFGVPTRELHGYPVHRDEFVPEIAEDAYTVIFGDFSSYLFLERVGISMQRITDATYASNNQELLLARRRIGGQLLEPWKLKVLKMSAS